MRRVLAALPLAFALLALPHAARAETNIFAEGHRFALGLGGGGGVYGITGKLFLNPSIALQAAAGEWGWPGLGANADVMLQMPQLWANDQLAINWYVGGGAGFVYGGAGALTITALAGASLQVKPLPIEVTVEFRPTVLVGGDLHGFDLIDGGSAIRYWF